MTKTKTAWADDANDLDVIIVGAGPAGLVAAYECEQSGLKVKVLEARERFGGRVYSHVMEETQFGEAGAEYFEPDQHRVNHFIDMFGLSRTAAFTNYDHVLMEGHLHDFHKPDKQRMPEKIREALPGHFFSYDLEHHFFRPLWKRLSKETANNGVPDEEATWAALLSMSVTEALDAIDADLSLRTYIRMRIVPNEGVELDDISAAVLAEEGWPDDYSNYSFHIEGGNHRLMEAFASSLREPVACGALVTEVHQHQEGVSVDFQYEGTHQEAHARYVLMAIPPQPLQRISFVPTLPGELRKALAAVSYTPVVKILMQFADRPWEACGWKGNMITDHPIYVWHSTEHQPGPAGILCFYATASAALHLRQLKEPERYAFLLGMLQQQGLLPEGCEPLSSVTFDWPADPLVGGGWSHFPLGQEDESMETLSIPVGRCYFAGEHIPDRRNPDDEDLMNTVESALSSGMAAARALLKQKKKAPTRWKRAILTPAGSPSPGDDAQVSSEPANHRPQAASQATVGGKNPVATGMDAAASEMIVDALEDDSFWQALGRNAPQPRARKVAHTDRDISPPAAKKESTPDQETATSAQAQPASAVPAASAKEPRDSAKEPRDARTPPSGATGQGANIFEMIGDKK